MKTISISHFKAFGVYDFFVDLSRDNGKKPRHLLVYGANGSGKTSIQEALKYAFFRTEDTNLEKFNALLPAETKAQKTAEVRNKYRNKQGVDDFVIKVDGVDIFDANYRADKYNAFIIKRSDLIETDSIILQDILERITYYNPSVLQLLTTLDTDIKNAVNNALKDIFFSDVRIELDPASRWKCTISDSSHNLGSSKNLSAEYNEAILSLIILLLITKSIGLLKESGKDNILILDDFVTSLDAVNRVAISKHIIAQLAKDYQLILLTHNISYYNLLMHIINNNIKTNDDWEIANLICVKSTHNFYLSKEIHKSESLKKRFESSAKDPASCDSIGNSIRQAFEARLHELTSIMMLGGMEDTKNILEKLESADVIYYKNGGNLQKLVAAIEAKTDRCMLHNLKLKSDIKKLINEYKVQESKDIIETLRELRLYQKVVMHPMSHGGGAVGWGEPEILHSLQLLEELEKSIASVNNGKF